MSLVQLNASIIEAFSAGYLSEKYDDPRPIPAFHREAWNLYASEAPNVSVVAPRRHGKSTALTFGYAMAAVCFRVSSYVIIIGSTEDKAIEQLGNISDALHDNEELRTDFGIASFEVDQKTEIIVTCVDGYQFRLLARGSEQKIRGTMWKNRRPDLIIGDDMEDDEQVESAPRRRKFRRWFFRAAKPALSAHGRIRVHGTILHEDSLLMRLTKNREWRCLFYKAHKSYDDFSEILWPEMWSEAKLRALQREFEAEGDATGYAQELLNDPYDRSDSYLKKEQFLSMGEDDHEVECLHYVGCDFAVSKADHADRTSFTVGGRCLSGETFIKDERVDRWDSGEWIAEMFSIEKRWRPQIWFVEGGVIWKTVSPILYREMNGATRSPDLVSLYGTQDLYLNIEVLNPVKDKGIRGRAFQRRLKAGMIRFDKGASWYGAYEEELLRFTGVAQARHDDQFDSTATLFIGIDKLGSIDETDLDELDTEEDSEYPFSRQALGEDRNRYTGY